MIAGRLRIRAGDGRFLSFVDTGDPAGAPMMYFHGTPSSASEIRLFGTADDLAAHGLRVIAIDRPGSAASTFQRGRSDEGKRRGQPREQVDKGEPRAS